MFRPMPVLFHVHQLFNAEQCQAYIHTLRVEKAGPLHCPQCPSHHRITRWGTSQYRPGCAKRYWCQELQAHLQRPHRDPLAPEQEAGGVLDTRHLSALPRLFSHSALPESRGTIPGPARAGAGGLRNAALSSEMSRQLEGIVEADDLYPDFDTNRYILTGVRGRGALNCMASWISCLDIWPKILGCLHDPDKLKRPQLLLYFYV